MVAFSGFSHEIFRNLIAKKGALSLAEALRSNEVLESLDLPPGKPLKAFDVDVPLVFVVFLMDFDSFLLVFSKFFVFFSMVLSDF